MLLRSRIRALNRVVERVPALHCPSGLYTLKFHLPKHLVKYLDTFASIHSTKTRPFEHLNLFIKQSYRLRSPLLSTRMQDADPIMGSIVHNLQRAGGIRKATQ